MLRRTFRPQEAIRAKSVGEVVSLLEKYQDKAKVLGGGTQLHELAVKGMIPHVERLVDIRQLGLTHIQSTPTELIMGASATFRSLEASKPIMEESVYEALADSFKWVRPPQIKHVATVAGSICSALPFFDIPVTLLALEARVKAVSPRGERLIPLDGFFQDYFLTSLRGDEFVTEVRVPRPPSGTVGSFQKLEATAVDIAIVNAAVSLSATDGRCTQARVAMGGGIARTPLRAKAAEKILEGRPLKEDAFQEAAKAAAAETKPLTDVRSTAEYRREMCKVLVRRALEAAAAKIRP